MLFRVIMVLERQAKPFINRIVPNTGMNKSFSKTSGGDVIYKDNKGS